MRVQDTRTLIDGLEAQLTAAKDNRDNADEVTGATNQLIVNAVKGDPNYGDDSDLYNAMGYVRRSAQVSDYLFAQQNTRRSRKLFRRVFFNLVFPAFKYSPRQC